MAQISSLSAQDQIPAAVFEQASEAFEQGKLPEAERALRGALEEHPRDAHALGMLGVILDAEKQYAEAEKCYDLALKREPLSTVLLNNLGNHYLVQGKSRSARGVYLRVVGLDAHHENANLHLAELSVDAGDGNSALHYLQQLSREAQSQPRRSSCVRRRCTWLANPQRPRIYWTRLKSSPRPTRAFHFRRG